LIKAGFLPVNIKFTDINKYYDCFDSYYGNSHTSDALVELLVLYETEEMNRYIKIIEDKDTIEKKYSCPFLGTAKGGLLTVDKFLEMKRA
jgi:hypothetical protein